MSTIIEAKQTSIVSSNKATVRNHLYTFDARNDKKERVHGLYLDMKFLQLHHYEIVSGSLLGAILTKRKFAELI